MIRRIKTSAVVQNALRVFLTVFLAAMAMSSAAATILDPLQGQTFTQLIQAFAQWATVIGAPLSTILVLVAGYLYMFSGGDQNKLIAARQTLTWAAVGYGIVLLSNGAAALVKSVLGV